MKNFRVLVVDDKKNVLDSIKDRIDRIIKFGNEDCNIEIVCLEVEIHEQGGNYQISETTITELYNLCEEPYDLLLLDFGFVKRGLNTVDEIKRIKGLSDEKTIREIIDKVVLNPSHLVSQSFIFPKYFKRINKTFIEHEGPIFIYTYIPNQFEQDYTSADVRRNVTNEQFPKAKITVIDTRKELFNNGQFDSKHDSEFYPFIISKFLSKIIHIELLESIVIRTESIKKKYYNYRKFSRLKILSALLLSILTGVLIPIIIETFNKGNILNLIMFGITIVLITAFVTYIIFNLEKQEDEVLKSTQK